MHGRIVHALAGGIGSIFAITVCFPLETARTRLQGVFLLCGRSGLYRGWFSLVVSLFVTNFVYFYIFHELKLAYQDAPLLVLFDLICGIIAGVVAVLVSNPLWVVNTRLKLQGAVFESSTYKELKHPVYFGIIDCIVKIVRIEGVCMLWSGLIPSLLLVLNPAVQFMLYEFFTRSCKEAMCTEVLDSFLYFLVGGIAKTVATLLTYPLQVAQTRNRAGLDVGITKLTDLVRGSIWKSLYHGLESKLTQTVLTAAFMYMFYENIKNGVFFLLGSTDTNSVR